MKTTMITTIILISNGRSGWNATKHFRPQADEPLDDAGIQQAEATGRSIAAKWQPIAVYSSPLPRAVRTAEIIAAHVNQPVEIHPGLSEIDYGEWQTITPEEAIKRWPDTVEAWYDAPHKVSIPGGETLDDLRRRAITAVNTLASRHVSREIVLVGHPIINRIILLGVLKLGNERFWHIQQELCAINVFTLQANDFILVSLNDTCHLNDFRAARKDI